MNLQPLWESTVPCGRRKPMVPSSRTPECGKSNARRTRLPCGGELRSLKTRFRMSRCQVPDCESVGMYRKLVAITQVAQAGSRETGVQKTSVFCTPKLPYFKRSFQAGTFNQPDSVCRRQCLHGISFGRTSLAYRFGVQKTDVLCTAKLGRTENFLFLYTVGVKPLKPLAYRKRKFS